MTVTIKYTKYQPSNSEDITEKFCLVTKGHREDREYSWLNVDTEELSEQTFKTKEEAMADMFRFYHKFERLYYIHFDLRERLVNKE